MRVLRTAVSLSAAVLVLSVLSAVPAPASEPAGLDDPIHEHIRPGPVQVSLRAVTSGFVAPLAAVAPPGDHSSLYVADQPGQIYRVDLATGVRSLFLDVTTRLPMVPLGVFGPNTYDERGLLGLAFSPTFATDHRFYTFTTERTAAHPHPDFTSVDPKDNDPACPLPDPTTFKPDHVNLIREWSVVRGAVTMVREVLSVANPQFNHTGGGLQFGPDGALYIAFGDGGGEDDQNCQIGVDLKVTRFHHEPGGNSQFVGNLMGKIVRIDPSRTLRNGVPSRNGQYSTLPLNPPIPGALPEIYAYGLRNPFRFSFDSVTSRLVAGDVGQNQVEEVDEVTAGGNYGWRQKEGTFLFDPAGFQLFGFATDGFVSADSPGSPRGLIDPIGEYDHDEGHAVIGGFVYRGTSIARLQGSYVFGDYSRNSSSAQGRVLTIPSRVVAAPGSMSPAASVQEATSGPIDIFVDGLGQDASHELYVMGNTTGVLAGRTGVLYKIVPNCGREVCR